MQVEAALHHSSHEITKAVLKAFMEPFWELERQGLLSNVRVVLFGSSVAADRRPNDIDVLIVANLDENAYVTKMNQLSPSADARMMEMLFSGGGEFNLTGMLHGWFPKGLHYQFLTEKEVLKTFDETTYYTDKTE